MDEEWIQVRMRRSTAQRLRLFAHKVLRLAEQGRITEVVNKHGSVCMDVAVGVLLDRDERHNGPKKRS